MSTPASRKIDHLISDALADAFRRIEADIDDHLTEEDVSTALELGWGEGVAEGWREWVADS